MLQDINWNLKTSQCSLKLYNVIARLEDVTTGLLEDRIGSYVRLLTYEDRGTWDCLVWRQKCLRMINLKTKVPDTNYFRRQRYLRLLTLKTKIPETDYIWRRIYLTLITFEGTGAWDCLVWRQKCLRLINLKTKLPDTNYFRRQMYLRLLTLKTKIPETDYFWRRI